MDIYPVQDIISFDQMGTFNFGLDFYLMYACGNERLNYGFLTDVEAIIGLSTDVDFINDMLSERLISQRLFSLNLAPINSNEMDYISFGEVEHAQTVDF